MARIAQIIPYFGKTPEWIDLYLYSCGRNPQIDFIIYTDWHFEHLRKPQNVKFVKRSFEDYCEFVSQRLGVDFKNIPAYKLADLKPFLGIVHKEELKNYEFWSFGDLDLCYGDMSMIINDRNLRKYDVITTHDYHIAGHCTIIRNSAKWTKLCFKIHNWKRRLCDSTHYGFDEGEWSALVFPRLRISKLVWEYIIKPLKITEFFKWMDFSNRILGGRRLFKEYYTSPEPKEGNKWIYDLNTGKINAYLPGVWGGDREIPYLHFLFFKKSIWSKNDLWWRNGFYKLHEDFDRYNTIEINNKNIQGY